MTRAPRFAHRRTTDPGGPTMPKPVPVPVRRKLLQLARRGEAAASLAAAFGLPVRTVRHLLKRFRDRGEAAVAPDYLAPRPLPHAHPAEVRDAALALRRDHPSWGAELIRVALRVGRPELPSPSATTPRRWSRDAGLGPAPRGHRPSGPRARAAAPHEAWQVDASERIPLRDGTEVCWLRVVDEASGAVLRTAVFPPGAVEPGASPGHPGRAPGDVRAVGPARAIAGGQRHAVGLAGRPADGPGLLAGRPGGGRGRQPAPPPRGQRRGRALSGGRQGLGGARAVRLGGRAGGAAGGAGPLAPRALPDARRAAPRRGLPRPAALGPGLFPRGGGDGLGRAPGLGAAGVLRRAPAGRLAGPGVALPAALSGRRPVGGPRDLGGFRRPVEVVGVPG